MSDSACTVQNASIEDIRGEIRRIEAVEKEYLSKAETN